MFCDVSGCILSEGIYVPMMSAFVCSRKALLHSNAFSIFHFPFDSHVVLIDFCLSLIEVFALLLLFCLSIHKDYISRNIVSIAIFLGGWGKCASMCFFTLILYWFSFSSRLLLRTRTEDINTYIIHIHTYIKVSYLI